MWERHLLVINFKRWEPEKSKIIHIEREMMEERGYDLSEGMKDEHFVNLYADNQEEAFREFLYRLIKHMQEENKSFCFY